VLLNDNSDAIKYQVANQSELVGWVEEDAIYLIPEAAYRAVIKFCRDQGEPFVISKNEILRRLERKKILVAFPDGERTQTLRCGGINHRIAQIKMSALKI
jgi:Ser/Thr protein kinase RdoA (MazF antagonist)